MAVDYNSTYTYPKQKLARSKKDKKWGRSCVDWVLQTANTNTYPFYQEIKANYDLYNNIIDKDDFKYVTDPYGIQEEFPAKLNNYNIITPKIKLLEGEEIKRPFNFRVVATNDAAVSQMSEKRKQLLLEYLEAELIADLQQSGVNVTDPATGEVMTPPQIEKYLQYSESDIRESTANKIADYIIKKENLEYKFNKGFKDAMISDMEFYYTGIDGDEPILETVNPLDFEYDMNPDLDFVHDGQWARHTTYCTVNSILDSYYNDLTDKEINHLDGDGFYGTSGSISNVQANEPANHNNNYHDEFSRNYIPVTRVEWKSMRKIGFLKYYDENLEEQEIIVDEEYEIDEEAGEEVEWEWISEVWEGTKIGNDIYCRIQPKRVQFRSIDNPSKCRLGYTGTTYNNRNSKSVSLLSLVKHHQYLYNVVMYRMEMEIAKAKGKKMIMDIAQIPRSQGMDMEKWMYYFDSLGIAFINSFEEGKGLGQGSISTFNQFTAVDMSLSQAVGQYIGILNKIEEQCETLMGVSRQRQGSISSNETVGGVERAVVQSSHITEPLFYKHNEVKKHVLTQLIEIAKVVYPSGKKINYILDDMSRVFLEISEEFQDADYGVFVTNSAKETKAFEDLKSIAEQAAASGLMTLTDLMSIFTSNSLAEVKNTIKDSEAKAQQEAQAEREAQMEQVQAQIEGQRQIENEKADRLDNREYIKGDIQKEIIALEKGLEEPESPDRGEDPAKLQLEYTKLNQQAKEHDDQIELEYDKLEQDKQLGLQKIAVDKIKARQKPKSTSTTKKK